MKVFYILDSFPSISENFILREILALKKSGLEIKICALRKAGLENMHPEALAMLGEAVYVEDISLRSKILAVAGNILRHPAYFVLLLLSLFRDIGFSFRFLYQRLRGAGYAMMIANSAGVRPDHVHAHFAYVTSDVARVLAGISGCRWSVSAHAWDIFTQPPGILARRIGGADRIFACSRHAKELLDGLCDGNSGRTVLAYHGVDSGEFGAGGERKHIIAVGRLEEKKGFDVLIRACGILASWNIRPRCIIVGDGPQRSCLEEIIRKEEIGNVELLGAKSFGKVRELIADSMMMVHSGRTMKNGDHDGIPNVILEAMACGKPVVASSVGGICEVLEDNVNGIIVRAEDQMQLAEAIRSLMNDKSLAERLGNAGRELVRKHFEISETVKPMFEYYLSNRKFDVNLKEE